jgi:hypothetical protein
MKSAVTLIRNQPFVGLMCPIGIGATGLRISLAPLSLAQYEANRDVSHRHKQPAAQRNAPELRIRRFFKSKSLGRNRVIADVRGIKDTVDGAARTELLCLS